MSAGKVTKFLKQIHWSTLVAMDCPHFLLPTPSQNAPATGVLTAPKKKVNWNQHVPIDVISLKTHAGKMVRVRLGLPLVLACVAACGASELPCDVFAAAGTPCVAAHSVVRALFAS